MRKRLDLGKAFAFRAGEGRRRNPRRMRLAASGAIALGGVLETGTTGPTGRPRRTPATRRAAMFMAPSGRLRFDPLSGGALSAAPLQGAASAQPVLPLRVIETPDFLVCAVVEARGGTLSEADRAALAAARYLADREAETAGAVVAIGIGSATGLDVAGADRAIALSAGAADAFFGEDLACRLDTVAESLRPRYVIFPETQTMRDVAARFALATGESPAFSVHGFEGDVCIRAGFGGAQDLRQETPRVLTVLEGAAAAVAGERFEARALDVDSDFGAAADARIEDLGLAAVAADDIALEEAPFILSAGAGVKDWDAFADVADRLNATRAGTRVVCDWGLMPRDRQVGASGRIATADCYVALGISGAVQHLQGIEKCARVVAVNLDAAAPIMKRADFAIVGDVNAVMTALQDRLGAESA
ncbi:MAG: electron transfer flavoprotein subunit alpha/FixB family protein [Pseudomonadota bacterium]